MGLCAALNRSSPLLLDVPQVELRIKVPKWRLVTEALGWRPAGKAIDLLLPKYGFPLAEEGTLTALAGLSVPHQGCDSVHWSVAIQSYSSQHQGKCRDDNG